MSNPLTGAYNEAQDKQITGKFFNNETSTKMGLEVIGSTAHAFCSALVDSAIQTPVNGVLQLFNPKEAHAFKLVENKQQEMNSPEWYGQLAGSSAGSLLNFIAFSKALKSTSESIKFAGSASNSKWRGLANTVSLIEKSPLYKKPFVSAAATGAFYGGILTPVDPNCENMVIARSKNAVIGAATVAALITPNQIRLRTNAIAAGESGSKLHQGIALALGGPLGGLVNSEARALSQGKIAPDVTGRDFQETMLAYSVLGAGYATYRSIGKAAEKPMEVEDFESTEKLRSTRRPENSGPTKTIDEHVQIVQEWNKFIQYFDRTLQKDIDCAKTSEIDRVELRLQYQSKFKEIQSQPANIRNVEPYEKLYDFMQEQLKAAESREALTNSKILSNLVEQQGIRHWTKKNAPQLPAPIDKGTLPSARQQNNISAEGYTLEDLARLTGTGADTIPSQPTGLNSSYLGRKIRDMQESMSNPNSPYYAKRANINSPKVMGRRQSDLAETIYSNNNPDANKGLPARNTTFEKKGYTAEQANRKAVVTQMTTSSQETAKGIGDKKELEKNKPLPWNSNDVP